MKYHYKPKKEIKVYKGIRGKIEEHGRIVATRFKKAHKREAIRKFVRGTQKFYGQAKKTHKKFYGKGGFFSGAGNDFVGSIGDLGFGTPRRKGKKRRYVNELGF